MTTPPVITICSSIKFYDVVKSLAQQLAALGIDVRTPTVDPDDDTRAVTPTEKHSLTLDFLEKVRTSDIIYIVNIGGYTGVSVSIETGFAFALGKRIVLAEAPQEPAIDALADDIASPEQFIQLCQGISSR